MFQLTEELLLNAGLYFVPAGSIAGGTKATGTLTLAENVTLDDTVTIGAVTYTFKAAPVATANEVKLGASASATLDNLIAAINRTAGAGDLYGSATVVHPTVSAAAGAGDTMDLTAKTAGTEGNAIATTETFTAAGNVFGAATLTGGVSGDVVAIDTKPTDFTEYEFGCINRVQYQPEKKTEERECSRKGQGGYKVKQRIWIVRDAIEFTTLEYNEVFHQLSFGLATLPTPGVEQTPFDSTFREIDGWMQIICYKENGGVLCTLEAWGTLRLGEVPEWKNESGSPIYQFEFIGSGDFDLDSILFAA
jgi:hypothetical protein